MHHHQHTHNHLPPPQSTILFRPESHSSTADAPPKQVSLAMDRLAHASRLIADIRLGADRLLEALFLAGEQANQSGGVNKPLHLIVQEGASMRQYLQDLRTVGRQLEDSGVLNESLKSRSNSWGLHMPLVCPDGAVVAYAWKRQLAGQAGASAVDRTRLALKAFTDQKRRFFPHLDEEAVDGPVSKKHRGAQNSTANQQEEFGDMRTVLDVLTELEKEVPEVKTSTYQRLDWLKRASLLPCETLEEPPKEHSFHSSRDMRSGLGGTVAADQIAVIELSIPSVFRAVISLHPTGSLNPDAVSFFSPDEGGSHVHARGVSAFNAFRNITEHAAMAPQYFIGVNADTALYSLLHWICSYQNLFTKACRKCEKLLSMDKEAALLLPPVQRPYRNFSLGKHVSQNSSSKDQCTSDIPAYHIGCFPQES